MTAVTYKPTLKFKTLRLEERLVLSGRLFLHSAYVSVDFARSRQSQQPRCLQPQSVVGVVRLSHQQAVQQDLQLRHGHASRRQRPANRARTRRARTAPPPRAELPGSAHDRDGADGVSKHVLFPLVRLRRVAAGLPRHSVSRPWGRTSVAGGDRGTARRRCGDHAGADARSDAIDSGSSTDCIVRTSSSPAICDRPRRIRRPPDRRRYRGRAWMRIRGRRCLHDGGFLESVEVVRRSR